MSINKVLLQTNVPQRIISAKLSNGLVMCEVYFYDEFCFPLNTICNMWHDIELTDMKYPQQIDDNTNDIGKNTYIHLYPFMLTELIGITKKGQTRERALISWQRTNWKNWNENASRINDSNWLDNWEEENGTKWWNGGRDRDREIERTRKKKRKRERESNQGDIENTRGWKSQRLWEQQQKGIWDKKKAQREKSIWSKWKQCYGFWY